MKNYTTESIYEKYYSVTAGRFYTPAEKRRLLALFAITCGIGSDVPELAELEETVSAVEELGVDSLTDCNNFLLVADTLPGKRELTKAVKALKVCRERAVKANAAVYFDPIDWRISVSRAKNDDPSAKLEAAYIEYARGSEETAVEYFEDMVERSGHLTSVERIAVISYMRGDYAKALEYFLILEDVMKNILSLECGEQVALRMTLAKAHLTAEDISLAEERAKYRVKKSFAFGRAAIGFNTVLQ